MVFKSINAKTITIAIDQLSAKNTQRFFFENILAFKFVFDNTMYRLRQIRQICVTEAKSATALTMITKAQSPGKRFNVENDKRIPLVNKANPLQISVTVRPTTRLKCAFCFKGEHRMAATKTMTFIMVTTPPMTIARDDITGDGSAAAGLGGIVKFIPVLFHISIIYNNRMAELAIFVLNSLTEWWID